MCVYMSVYGWDRRITCADGSQVTFKNFLFFFILTLCKCYILDTIAARRHRIMVQLLSSFLRMLSIEKKNWYVPQTVGNELIIMTMTTIFDKHLSVVPVMYER